MVSDLHPPIDADPVPRRQWQVSLLRLLGRPLPDRWYMTLAHWLYFRRWPDFDHPRTLQEHIQAYVLRTRDPALVMLADKVAVRDYIARTLGSTRYNVPLLGIWRHEDEVPRRVIAEPLLRDAHGDVPPDIKAYVIGGRVRYFQVDGGRFTRPPSTWK